LNPYDHDLHKLIG